MKPRFLALLLTFVFFAIACEKEIERMDNFLLEFATVQKSSNQLVFRLDNQRELIPKEIRNYSGNDGQRVILNFTPINGDTIKINAVSDIFTEGIKESDEPGKFDRDEVKIQSIWVSGGYLNMILEIDFNSKKHTVGLYRNSNESPTDIYFSHSRNDDPPGYAKKLYASFSLTSLLQENHPESAFRLLINTYSGERVISFEI